MTPLDPDTPDSLLIAGLARGDRAAFDAIYYKYVRQLMAYAQSYLRVLQDSEEVVEDVFISLWRTRSSIRSTESLRPLLFISARNRILSALRKRINSGIYEEFVTHRHELSGEDTPLEYDEFERMVMDCVDSLPSTQRRVVRMSRFDNLSNREIADALNLSEQTVRNALSQGLKTLQLKIKACHGGPIITIISIAIGHLVS